MDAGFDDGTGAPIPSGIVGAVDSCSAAGGIRGWAVDRLRPLEALSVRLMAGDRVLAETRTSYMRDDVAQAEGLPGSGVGFHFPPETFFAFCDLSPDLLESRPGIRVAGAALPGVELPTVAECIDIAEAIQPGLSMTDRATDFADLSEALDVLELEARVVRRQGGAGGRRQVGFLEAFRRIEKDTYVIAGWLSEPGATEFPAYVAQDRKWPAGVVIATYARADLPAGALAFIGLMRTAWMPGQAGARFGIVFRAGSGAGSGGEERHIAPIDGVQQPPRPEFARMAEGLIRNSNAPETMLAIQRQLALEAGWTVSADHEGAQLHLDEILLVPSFGLFLKGWMLNGPRRLTALQLRAGDAIARVGLSTMTRHPRPDLLGGFPWAGAEVGAAGFSACARGPVRIEDLQSLMLRAVHADGGVTVRALDLRAVRILGDAEGIARLGEIYPQIQEEPFFPALQAALRREIAREIARETRRALPGQAVPALARADTRTDTGAGAGAAPPLLCLQFGPAPGDVDIQMERLLARAARWPKAARLALMTDTATPRTLVQAWRAELKAAGIADCRLVPADADHGLLRLAGLHGALPFGRFAWIRPGAVPKAAGWDRIFAHLAGSAEDGAEDGGEGAPNGGAHVPGPVALATVGVDPVRPQDAALGALLWSAGPFLDWAAASPVRFAQDYLAALMAGTEAQADRGAPPAVLPDTAFVIPRHMPSAFLRRMDTEIDERSPV